MPALRCKDCGLVNFATAEVCKRCRHSLPGASSQPNPGSDPPNGVWQDGDLVEGEPLTKKCPACGIVNVAETVNCRRCYWEPSYGPHTPYTSPAVTKKPTNQKAIGVVLSVLATRSLMSLLPPEISNRISVAVVAGLIAGLIPFFVARSRGQKKLAEVSLWICVGSGLVLGLLLALPAAIVLTIISLSRPVQAKLPTLREVITSRLS